MKESTSIQNSEQMPKDGVSGRDLFRVYKRSLSEDLSGRLDEVSRGYIRKPAVIIASIILFVIAIPIGILEAWSMCWTDFVIKCWNGTQHDR